MEPEKAPEVVDLRRYKAEQAAKAKEKARLEAKAASTRAKAGADGDEPLLGGRPKAGLILVLAVAAAAALLILPRFLG